MATNEGEQWKGEAVPVPAPVVTGASCFSGSRIINPSLIKDNPGMASLVSRGGEEERKGEAVPVVTGSSYFSGSRTINPPLSKDNPGMASLVARGGGEMLELEMVPVTCASGGFVRSANETARSVACFALVHAAVALIVFLVLKEQDAEKLDQCVEACPVLTIVEFYSILFHRIYHVTMKVCSVVQMLAAVLAMVSTGRTRRAASLFAIFITVVTGTQSIRLVYTALFGSHCCFSGGIVQVASAVTAFLGQGAFPFCGVWFAYELMHAPLP